MAEKISINTSEFRRMIALVDVHDKILVRGNGEPSLQENMRRVLEYIKDEKDSRQFYSRLMVGLVLTNLVGLAVAAFAWFMKVLPVIDELSRAQAVMVR